MIFSNSYHHYHNPQATELLRSRAFTEHGRILSWNKGWTCREFSRQLTHTTNKEKGFFSPGASAIFTVAGVEDP